MYNWVTRRKIERSQPQQVFKVAVDAAIIAWMPAIALAVSSCVTPSARKLDVRAYDWSTGSAGWIANIPASTGPTVAQTLPAWQAVSYRTADRRGRDVRYQDAPPLFGVPDDPAIFDGAIFSDDGGRTADRQRLDVRRYEWANGPGWIVATFPAAATQAQLWPAISAGSDPNYRTRDRAKLDVRGYDWAPQPAWITSILPQSATAAQIWPALQQNLGTQYRTPDRARLDVRRYDWSPAFTWVQPVVDATVAKWAPVFAEEASSFRTIDRARLDIRRYDWAPSFAWSFTTLPTAFPRVISITGSTSTGITLVGSRSTTISIMGSTI